MGILTKMQNTSKLAATEYGSTVNPSLMRAMQAASEFDRCVESSDASDDLLAELYENADYALSDLQSRMQEYNIHVTSVRDLQELFLSSYRELYVSTIVPSLQAKVKDFESLLDSRKLSSFDDIDGTMWEKIKNPLLWGKIKESLIKVFDTFKENLKMLASFIPGINARSEYRTRLESIFGEDALRNLHDETNKKIIPLIEDRLRKRIDSDFAVYKRLYR
jgi:hypothetical protein